MVFVSLWQLKNEKIGRQFLYDRKTKAQSEQCAPYCEFGH
jgi:hypothetical protein